jgi:cell division protein FtsB
MDEIVQNTIALTIGQQAIQLAQLRGENQKLKQENDQLKKLVAKNDKKGGDK